MSDNPLDPLEELDALQKEKKDEQKKKPKSPQRSKEEFESPLDRLQRSQTSRVTKRGKSVMHGKRKQVTFRLDMEYVDAIDGIADDLSDEGVSKEDVKRWLVAMGVEAYAEGHRPDTEDVSWRTVIVLPDTPLDD